MSKHGGKRVGAGRKTGSATKRTREIADKALASGITPLEFMLDILRTEPPKDADPLVKLGYQEQRFEAAKAAAPYVHPKLQAITHKGSDGGPIKHNLLVEFVGIKK